MISQRCPKCGSSRIRRGYRPTPLWRKIFFQYNLLCDGCNWEFKGFAVPGTVSHKPTRRPKSNSEVKSDNEGSENKNPAKDKIKRIKADTNNKTDQYKKRVRVKP